ncbi:DUF6350 family protein [Nocardia sp. NPDC052566]|uniref:cell division protein PerM n=1 Tax=Nocardia sp. NPDC052566 TaxID=3364330 RepID=UPI0037C54ADE
MSSPRNALVRRTGASQAEPEPQADAADEAGFLSLSPERARALLLVAARPAAVTLTALTVAILATLFTSGGGMDGAAGAIAAGWLGAHQVPLVIGKTSLGLLPLLPTAFVLWLAGRECARAAEPDSSRADLGWLVGAALAGPLLVTAVCLAVTEDASGVVALQPPNTLAAFGWVALLHLLAAAGGIVSRTRGQFFELVRAPEWAIAGVYGAGRTILRLLAAATAVTIISFLAHWSQIGATYQSAGNAAGVIGLSVLSLAYLPNMALLATGVLVGGTAQFGSASVALFSVAGGPIPAVPVMAAVPFGPAAGWWSVLLVLPAAVGVLGGIDTARTSEDRAMAPWATLTSAGLATVVVLLLAVLAGGELGSFGHVGLELPIFAVLTFGWLAIGGYAGLLCARWFVIPAGARSGYDDYDADDYHADDYEDDDYEDGGDDSSYDDDDYADDEYYEYADYDGPDLEVEIDGELVDEQPAIGSGAPHSAGVPDIVDAEVVETDLPDADPVPGR